MAALAVREDQTRRIAGAIFVAVLHIVLILALLQASSDTTVPETRPAPEMIMWFLLPAKPKPAAPNPSVQTQARPVPRPEAPVAIPSFDISHLPPLPPKQEEGEGLPGLKLFLFDCKPEDLDKLTPKQRAECISAGVSIRPPSGPDFRDHTNRATQAERWRRERQRKNQPPLLPCMNPNGMPSLSTLLCLGKGAINGFDPDSEPMYGDQPGQDHLPNNGDAPAHVPGPGQPQ
jgi:hypothetical protein